MLKQCLKTLIVFFLTCEARLALKKYRPRIIAVTGTVGKTTTKDAIHAALSGFFPVWKSEKSFNSELGVPLAILHLANGWNNPLRWAKNFFSGLTLLLLPFRYPRFLVLEVGADRPGDIRRMAGWLRPEVAVITRFAEVPVHVEFFSSPEELIEEKTELARAVPEGGVLILGSDDAKVRALRGAFKEVKTICFGLSEDAQVRARAYEVRYESREGMETPVGCSFTVEAGGASFPVTLSGALGEHLMQSVLAAFAVSLALNLDLSRVAEAMTRRFAPPAGRMRIIAGAHGAVLIDDSYNSSPVAAAEALKTLASLRRSSEGARRIAVLGDMMELGGYTFTEHKKVGALAALSCDLLVAVGLRAKGIAEGAREARMGAERVRIFSESAEAGAALRNEIQAGDAVLIKGSQAVRLERVVQALMAEPGRAAELLPRQEKEWLKR